jgi:hypothetical protein
MSLLIPTLLSQPTGSGGGGGAAKAYDLGKDSGGSPANRYLRMSSGHGVANTTAFTLVMFLDLPSTTIGGSQNYWVARGPLWKLEFSAWTGSGGGCRLKWSFWNVANTQATWEGRTTTYLLPNTKYCIALAFNNSGATRQLYVNGVSEPVQNETYNSGDVRFSDAQDFGKYSTTYYPMIMGPLWIADSFIDLSTNIGNFVTGGTSPVDNANGCEVYMDMTNLTNKGSGGNTLSAPDGTLYQVNW